jgi:hypothetical protein
LETALNIYGLVPDIPAIVTSVTTITPNVFNTPRGDFSYSVVKPELFFGYNKIPEAGNEQTYNLAEPEKALLDWMYLRKVASLTSHRIELNWLDKLKLRGYSEHYPLWVRRGIGDE